LSGGEQQRVAIARALVNQPELLLADEPTGELDSRTGDRIMELIESLHRDRGVTVIMTSHDPRISERAPRVVRLEDGRIVG
jgi:putative ABC transport system ATP-binding protein